MLRLSQKFELHLQEPSYKQLQIQQSSLFTHSSASESIVNNIKQELNIKGKKVKHVNYNIAFSTFMIHLEASFASSKISLLITKISFTLLHFSNLFELYLVLL